VLFVIACCAFVSTEPLHLSWWPLARDCSYYCFALAALVIFVSDLKVEHYEAIILFLMYCGYVTVMYFNEWLERNVKIWVEANEKRQGIGLRKMMITVFENKVRRAPHAAPPLLRCRQHSGLCPAYLRCPSRARRARALARF
jgi:Ca2+/Na+ antiporter